MRLCAFPVSLFTFYHSYFIHFTVKYILTSSELGQVSLSYDQSSISSSDSVSQVGNMSLRKDLNDVNKMIKFLKFNTRGKNKNGSPAATRGLKSSVKND